MGSPQQADFFTRLFEAGIVSSGNGALGFFTAELRGCEKKPGTGGTT